MLGIIAAAIGGAIIGALWALGVSDTDLEEMERWRKEDEE